MQRPQILMCSWSLVMQLAVRAHGSVLVPQLYGRCLPERSKCASFPMSQIPMLHFFSYFPVLTHHLICSLICPLKEEVLSTHVWWGRHRYRITKCVVPYLCWHPRRFYWLIVKSFEPNLRKKLWSLGKIWDVHQERLNDKNTEGAYWKYFNQTGEDIILLKGCNQCPYIIVFISLPNWAIG